jgi:hypothetical protein
VCEVSFVNELIALLLKSEVMVSHLSLLLRGEKVSNSGSCYIISLLF